MKLRSWSREFRYVAYPMWFVSAIAFVAASDENGLLSPGAREFARWVSYFSLLWCVAQIARRTNRLLQIAEARVGRDPSSEEYWTS